MKHLKGLAVLLVLLLALLPLAVSAEEADIQPDTELPAAASVPDEGMPADVQLLNETKNTDGPALPEPDEAAAAETEAETSEEEDSPETPDRPAPSGDADTEPAELPVDSETHSTVLPDWDEEIRLSETFRADTDALPWQRVLRLSLIRGCHVTLSTQGLPVTVTMIGVETGWRQELRPVLADGDWQPIETTMSLRKGTYLICLTKLTADAKGTVRLTVTEAQTSVSAEAETDEAPAEEPISEEAHAEEEVPFPAETEDRDTAESVIGEGTAGDAEGMPEQDAISKTEETPGDAVENSTDTDPPVVVETEEIPENDYDDNVDPDDGIGADETPQTACEGIQVTVSTTLNGKPGTPIGAEVTLTATVIGCDPSQVTIEWQYSPDGGTTVIAVEDAHSFEYHYTVDRTNKHYLWRAVITLTSAQTEE